ncbi:CUE5 [Candida margitis]|uniref:CUE5 n=1 Tax=Candida margitis TaxID=1775924 RepID=UPI002225BEB7|nr:CUE5 [Candida margitis]KAI5969174.1 CUE5 [Candida margitis]
MAKGKKDDLKAVSAEPLDSISDSKVEKKESKDSGVSEATKKESIDKSKDSEKEAPIEDVPLADDNDEKKDSTEKKAEDVATTTAKDSSDKQPQSTEKAQSTETKSEESAPPVPPKRPTDPVEQIVQDLKDAFPQTEDKLITAVLIASQGNPEPAFGALLYLSDPTFKPDIPVYPQHQPTTNPRAAFGSGVVRSRAPSDTSHTFTDDEILARKLQKEFELEDERQRRRREEKARQRHYHGKKGSREAGAGNAAGLRPSHERRQRNGDDDAEYYDDDSPDDFDTIKETFSQGLEEARTTINGWVSGLAKKFDNTGGSVSKDSDYDRADNDDYERRSQRPPPRQQFGSKSHRDGGNNFGNLGGGRYYDDWKNKKNRTRFDEDPEIITGDFKDQITINDKDSLKSNEDKRSKGGAETKKGGDAKGEEEEDDPETTPNLPRRPRMSSDVQDDSRKGHSTGETRTGGNKTVGAGASSQATNNAFSVDDSDDDDENSNLVKSG